MLRYDRRELIKDPRAYLFRIAANVSAEWAAHSSRRRPHSAEWLDDLADSTDLSADAERAAADRELGSVLAELPPRVREILRLLHHEGLTYEQIAERLQLTRRTVKRDIAKAYALLRVSLTSHMGRG